MRKLLLLGALFAVGCGGTMSDPADEAAPLDVMPSGRGVGTLANHYATLQAGKPGGNGISYHGGPVMLGTPNVYIIWYGNWTGNSATTILTDLATNMGGSAYFMTNTGYYNAAGQHVTGAIRYAGSTTDNYSQGASFTDAAVGTIVSSAISSGRLPSDTNGIYFVFTSADVRETSGFCTSWCGWHTHGTIGGVDIKYSIVANPETQCPNNCGMGVTPNGNLGADAMASIFAHELEETVTDPDLNAWFDTRGYEDADKCAWTFGVPAGSQFNTTIGTRNYLIQQEWVNASGGFCAMHL